MFEEYKINVEGKKAVIIGRSNIVGKPMASCLLNANATVIIIAACGKKHFVKSDMVKEGAVIIDVGTNVDENGKVCGDVDFENVKYKASFITPNPGGVGPMTVAMLINNVVKENFH